MLSLHGEKGGPLFCPFCIGTWQGEFGKKLKWRRIVVRALKAYEAAGGSIWGKGDLDEMRLAAGGMSVSNLDANYVPSEVGISPLSFWRMSFNSPIPTSIRPSGVSWRSG